MLVTVASFTEPWEAHLFRGRLDAEGLFAVIAHEHHVWNNWPYGLALGGVKVQVAPSEHDAALDVLARCRAGDYHAELAAELGPLETPHCPSCGSGGIDSRRAWPAVLLLIASYFIAGVIFPLRATALGCRDCGTRWREGTTQQTSPNAG